MNLITNLLHLHRDSHPVRFAVVGLGNFAQTAILPAFANTGDKAELAALVTGDVEKAAKLSRKYKAPAYSYDDYEGLLGSGKVEAVYIATPNSEHRTFAEPAARAKVHVLVRKAAGLFCRRRPSDCRRLREAQGAFNDCLPAALRGRKPRGDRSGAFRQDRRSETIHVGPHDAG